MNKLQRGFAAIETLLILIIIGVIGGTGYYVWHSKSSTEKSLNNAASSQMVIKPKNSQAAAKTSPDTELIAAAIADKCQQSQPNLNKPNLEKILLSNYSGNDSSLVQNGNYARAGSTCDDTNSGQGGGFGSWLMKKSGTWTVAFQGQQPPDCKDVDGQGWPNSVLAQCYDAALKDYRAPK